MTCNSLAYSNVVDDIRESHRGYILESEEISRSTIDFIPFVSSLAIVTVTADVAMFLRIPFLYDCIWEI